MTTTQKETTIWHLMTTRILERHLPLKPDLRYAPRFPQSVPILINRFAFIQGTTSSTSGPNLDPTKVNVSHSRLAPAEGRDPEETRNTVPLPPSRNPPAWPPSHPSSGPRDDASVPTPTPRFPALQQFPSWDLRAKPMTVAASELGNFDWPTFINTQRAPRKLISLSYLATLLTIVFRTENAQASSSRPPPDPSTGYSSLNSLVSPQAWQQFQQQQRQHEQQHEEHPRHQPRRQIHTNPVGSGGGPEDWLDWVATMAPQMPPPHNPNVVYGYEADLAVGLPHPRSHVPAADDLEGSRQSGSSVTSHMSTRATTPPR
jgi:hypothetical protein